jgi:hypothetical protein
MSIELAQTLDKTLEDILPMADLVGMRADVEAARNHLKTVETSDDLFAVYRTDVPAGNMSVRNLLAVIMERMTEVHCRAGYAIQRIEMTLKSAHVESLHKLMKDKKKGDIAVNLYQPTYTASDLEKAMETFKETMGDGLKPKLVYAEKKGKGLRCARLFAISKPVTANSKKTYSSAQIDAAKNLIKVMRHT